MNNGIFLHPNRETQTLILIKIDDGNVPFSHGEEDVYDENNNLINETHNVEYRFRGRPATHNESKTYRLTKGVQGTNGSVMIISSNLPDVATIGDRVIYLGGTWTIQSITTYIDENNFVNSGVFSNEYIKDRCPKLIQLG